MATIQRVSHSSLGESPNDYGLSKGGGNGGGEAAVSDQFPAGLRVLVVDDDTTCLRIIEQMLRRCLYHVTLCSQAAVALNLLREKKECFDVVLSDVHMPNMDGYKLLEYVGLEMKLPVIMMSADKRTSAVRKGIRHGACDYLIKPIREEELKNIWQHVVRKKWKEYKELENSESLVENDKQMRGTDDAECASSAHEEEGIKRANRKRSSSKEDERELENDDPSASKKSRVVWSVELHQQFVIAVDQLGLDKAVPKRILELMNVPGLTRENVASHLHPSVNGLRQLWISHICTYFQTLIKPRPRRKLELPSYKSRLMITDHITAVTRITYDKLRSDAESVPDQSVVRFQCTQVMGSNSML